MKQQRLGSPQENIHGHELHKLLVVEHGKKQNEHHGDNDVCEQVRDQLGAGHKREQGRQKCSKLWLSHLVCDPMPPMGEPTLRTRQ